MFPTGEALPRQGLEASACRFRRGIDLGLGPGRNRSRRRRQWRQRQPRQRRAAGGVGAPPSPDKLEDFFPTGIAKAALLDVVPLSGPPGTEVTLSGRGFRSGETIQVRFDTTTVARISADEKGSFSARVTVPPTPFRGSRHDFLATGMTSVKTAEVPFLVE